MAQCKLIPQDFIQNAFSPMVAVMCSPLVDQACRKNNLTFIELLQPFCKLNAEAQFRDPSGAAVAIRNLRITVQDINARPPQPTLARKFLNSSVTVTSEVKTATVHANNYELEIPTSVPWFETWRETFLHVQYPSDHEFTKHFLACMIVISSSEINPLESLNDMLQNLTQLQSSRQAKLPKWFSSNVLRYFVVLHDTLDGNNDNAVKTLENLKLTYGVSNCFLLQINSRPPGLSDDQILPDPWSQFLLRKLDKNELVESESPRMPNDSSGVISMPSKVTSDITIFGANMSPTIIRNLVQKLEIGQEANEATSVPVNFHPLSPEVETREMLYTDEEEAITLPINSNVWRSSATTQNIIHGACLTTDDIEQLKSLVHEFCLKALLPYVEKQIQQISDLISNKKGVSRSLFSATKRWFTPNKPGTSGTTTTVNSITYAPDSSELQVRKLADLYFLFGHYTMAFSMYHSAKRDFNADQAWLYYAGALEMAAVSAFLCGEVTRKTCDYMEESITTYLYTCRMPQFATRATLLSTECLKGKNQYGEAANQFIRMTSEDSDLRSALLLEQAAYCFLNCNKPRMIRKYAFHIILAGHRFSKCLQRKHSLRCYRQAFQVYINKGWSLAEDHIYFTIGRQAFNLNQLNEATDALSKLLTPNTKQNSQQQTIFLREYLSAHQALVNKTGQLNNDLPILHIPVLYDNETKVLLGPQPPFSTPGRVPASGVTFSTNVNDQVFQKWNLLEKMMVQESSKTNPLTFKPMITFYSSKTNDNTKPIAAVGEPIQISVALHNTLEIVLSLKDVFLLWEFVLNNEDMKSIIKNECVDAVKTDKYIKTHSLSSVHLASDCKEELILSVTPLTVGELIIHGICYTIINNGAQNDNSAVIGKQLFNVKPSKNKIKENVIPPENEEDRKLEITIAPSAPCLQVGFSEINHEMLCNEFQNVSIELRNCGSIPLHKIMVASSMPHLFSLPPLHIQHSKYAKCEHDYSLYNEKEINKNHVIPIMLPSHLNGRLEPGQSYVLNLLLRAPATKGSVVVDLLFYYENINSRCIPRYRLVKHLWHLSVQESLETEVNAQPSCYYNGVETLTLSLRSTNSNKMHHAAISEMHLLQAGLLSNKWELSKDVIFSRDDKLHCQESVHFMLKAFRAANVKQVPVYSETLLSLRMNVNPDIKIPCINFAQKILSNDLNIMDNPLEIKDLFSSLDMMLILGWQALVTDSAGNTRTAVGQQYIPITILADKGNKLIEKQINLLEINNTIERIPTRYEIPVSVLRKQVFYNLTHPQLLKHNFKTNKLCIIPVLLMLHSSVNNDLIVKVNTLGNTSAFAENTQRNGLFNPNSSNYFRWIGHSEFLCYLKAFSSQQLQLNAAVSVPGTYNLAARIEIFCRPLNQLYELVSQSCKSQSALIVRQVEDN